MARNKEYTRDLADEICERLAAGESLRAICGGAHMPARTTVLRWVESNREGFASRYSVARDAGLDVMADETIEIADTLKEGSQTKEGPNGKETTRRDLIEHRRLQVDARKWYLSKLAPKRYGDKSSVELTGADGGPVRIMNDIERGARIAAILASAEARKAQAEADAEIADLL